MILATYESRFGNEDGVKTDKELTEELIESFKVPCLAKEKLIRILESLSKEEICELQAVMWLGRDSVTSDELNRESSFEKYYEYAFNNYTVNDVNYILGKSNMLPKYLIRGMIAVEGN